MNGMPLTSSYLGMMTVELIALFVISGDNLLQFRLGVAMVSHQIKHITPAMLVKSIVGIMPEEESQVLALVYKILSFSHVF